MHAPRSTKAKARGSSSRAGPLGLAVSVLLLLGCSSPPASAPSASAWVMGHRAEWHVDEQATRGAPRRWATPTRAPDRRAAAEAFLAHPDEAATVSLARAYFAGDLLDVPERADPAPDPRTSLSVRFVDGPTETVELTTRGLTFRVHRVGGESERLVTDGASFAFAGARRLLAPVGPCRRAGDRLLTDRFESYDVVAPGPAFRERLVIELPPEVRGLRDAGAFVELSDGRGGPPVLRLHVPEVRDRAGRARSGQLRLAGVEQTPTPADFLARASSVTVDVSVELDGLEGPLVVDPGWSSTGAMATPRTDHTATLLPSGTVLVIGGNGGPAGSDQTAELYDPGTGIWSAITSRLHEGRTQHTATMLPTGKVLVAGGLNASTGNLASAELFDPATAMFTTLPAMTAPRTYHTATLLTDGRVLLAGGHASSGSLSSAELFDPVACTFTPTSPMAAPRGMHVALRLSTGKVLVAGGWQVTPSLTSGALAGAELFDPATGSWAATATPMTIARSSFTGTTLADGRVLLSGGQPGGTSGGSAELFDPATRAFTAVSQVMLGNRSHQSSTLLPSGQVLVADGYFGQPQGTSAELFGPGAGTWTATSPTLRAERSGHTATRLSNGDVLITGGFTLGSGSLTSSEVYSAPAGGWASTGSMHDARTSPTVTPLPNGKLLVVGGGTTASAELFDPVTGTFAITAPPLESWQAHTATLLPSGKVLVCGGLGAAFGSRSAELYDPATGTWTRAGDLATGRAFHVATLLPSGKVLVAGGQVSAGSTSTAELFDPTTGTFSATGAMAKTRADPVGVLLPTGKVLVAGGADDASAEVFDPATSAWTSTGLMSSKRNGAVAALLASGRVLVASGHSGTGFVSSAELYDPATGGWSATGSMAVGRQAAIVAVLPSGRVLVAGGCGGGFCSDSLASSEVYDPTAGIWSTTATPMQVGRRFHAAALTPSGAVLVVGGMDSPSGLVSSAELYVEAAPTYLARPTIGTVGALVAGQRATVTGTHLRGIMGGSNGATNDSPTDFPVVSLASLSTGVVTAAPVAGYTDTSFDALVPAGLSPGSYLLQVSVNGLPTRTAVTVTKTNHAPVVTGAALTTAEDAPVVVALPASDQDGDVLTFSTTAPRHGTLSGTGASLTYSPAPDFVGDDAFTVTANDGAASSAAAEVRVTVGPVNDAPTLDEIGVVSPAPEARSLTVALTGLGPGGGPDEAGQTLVVEAVSDDSSRLPDPTVSGVGSERTLTLHPERWVGGDVAVTVTVRDSGGTANGGADVTARTFRVALSGDREPGSPTNPIGCGCHAGAQDPVALLALLALAARLGRRRDRAR